MVRKAVVLLSGGIDSTVTAYVAKKDIGKTGELYAITFEYGQMHSKEIVHARDIAKELEVKDHLEEWELRIPTESSLLVESPEQIPTEEAEGIPSTWVPQRNSIFLALAFAYAESIEADSVYIGVNSRDYSGYPDCRPEFIEAMTRALNLASKQFVETGKGIGIIAPLQFLFKADIIQLGTSLGVDFSKTWSCYRGEAKACGKCPSCLIRLRAFKELGLDDPIEYEKV